MQNVYALYEHAGNIRIVVLSPHMHRTSLLFLFIRNILDTFENNHTSGELLYANPSWQQ
jgi:hypothetical protein